MILKILVKFNVIYVVLLYKMYADKNTFLKIIVVCINNPQNQAS